MPRFKQEEQNILNTCNQKESQSTNCNDSVYFSSIKLKKLSMLSYYTAENAHRYLSIIGRGRTDELFA